MIFDVSSIRPVDSPPAEQQASLLERQLRMREDAALLLSEAGQAWGRPAAFSLGLTGAVWALGKDDIVGNLLALGTDVSDPPGAAPSRAGAFSYLFSDQSAG